MFANGKANRENKILKNSITLMNECYAICAGNTVKPLGTLGIRGCP